MSVLDNLRAKANPGKATAASIKFKLEGAQADLAAALADRNAHALGALENDPEAVAAFSNAKAAVAEAAERVDVLSAALRGAEEREAAERQSARLAIAETQRRACIQHLNKYAEAASGFEKALAELVAHARTLRDTGAKVRQAWPVTGVFPEFGVGLDMDAVVALMAFEMWRQSGEVSGAHNGTEARSILPAPKAGDMTLLNPSAEPALSTKIAERVAEAKALLRAQRNAQ